MSKDKFKCSECLLLYPYLDDDQPKLVKCSECLLLYPYLDDDPPKLVVRKTWIDQLCKECYASWGVTE